MDAGPSLRVLIAEARQSAAPQRGSIRRPWLVSAAFRRLPLAAEVLMESIVHPRLPRREAWRSAQRGRRIDPHGQQRAPEDERDVSNADES